MAVIITGNNTPTAGGITYGDGSTYANTAAGTSGQLLQSNGAAAPTWVAAPSSAMTFLSTVTISNSATADVETTFNSTYDTYMIVGKINTTTGANPTLNCRLKIGGSYVTTADYAYHTSVSGSNASTYSGLFSTGSTSIQITGTIGADASYSIDFVMYVQNPTSTIEQKGVFWTGRYRSVGNQNMTFGQGAYTLTTAALTGVRFFTSADNLVSGYVRLYGIAKS